MKPQPLSLAAILVIMLLAFGCVPSSDAGGKRPGMKAGRSSGRTPSSLTTTPSDDAVESSRRFQRNQPTTGPIAEARKQLLDTARRIEGDFIEVVADIVDAVESGDQPWSVADHRMRESRPGHHRFSRETIAAYERWKATVIAEHGQ